MNNATVAVGEILISCWDSNFWQEDVANYKRSSHYCSRCMRGTLRFRGNASVIIDHSRLPSHCAFCRGQAWSPSQFVSHADVKQFWTQKESRESHSLSPHLLVLVSESARI